MDYQGIAGPRQWVEFTASSLGTSTVKEMMVFYGFKQGKPFFWQCGGREEHPDGRTEYVAVVWSLDSTSHVVPFTAEKWREHMEKYGKQPGEAQG